MRWRHPTRGLISPAEFVTVAEQAGLGRALTRRMLELALAQVRAWREQGFDLHVAVNTTVADLQDTQFPAEVAATLVAYGLPPEVLVLEVTENMVLADPVRVGDVLAQLGELGLGLSLDDFGTGFSSLTHLKALPVGEVKIDRSFVGRMTTDPVDAAIVQATIQLAHSHRHPRRRRGDRGPGDVELAGGQPLRARAGVRALAAAAGRRPGVAPARRAERPGRGRAGPPRAHPQAGGRG